MRKPNYFGNSFSSLKLSAYILAGIVASPQAEAAPDKQPLPKKESTQSLKLEDIQKSANSTKEDKK